MIPQLTHPPPPPWSVQPCAGPFFAFYRSNERTHTDRAYAQFLKRTKKVLHFLLFLFCCCCCCSPRGSVQLHQILAIDFLLFSRLRPSAPSNPPSNLCSPGSPRLHNLTYSNLAFGNQNNNNNSIAKSLLLSIGERESDRVNSQPTNHF